MRVTKKQAAAMQIDAAIGAYERRNFPAVVTLAAAAEECMPPSDTSLFKVSMTAGAGYFKDDKEAVRFLNTARDWLKHNGPKQPPEMDLDKEPISYLIRAVSRYHDAYGRDAETETMQRFFAAARLDVD